MEDQKEIAVGRLSRRSVLELFWIKTDGVHGLEWQIRQLEDQKESRVQLSR